MQRTQLRPEAANYLRDNGGLVPDVWACLLELEETEQPIGTPRADFYIVDVLQHWVFYKWFSPNHKEVLLIKPK